MLQKELRQHQWKAFRRNPMFERNMGVKIFMFFMFGILALEFLALGFYLDKLLLEAGGYVLAIYTFNSFLLYLLAVDFAIKFFFKTNQSMQIMPYLTLPIKRKRLFNFLLRKEFTSFWNYYLLFLVIPFALKSIPPYFGTAAAFLYIIFFYLLCVCISLLVNIINNWINKSAWFYILAILIVISPFVITLGFDFDLGNFMQQTGERLLKHDLWIWGGFIVTLIVLWGFNRLQMRSQLYHEIQGGKKEKASSFSNVSALNQLGGVGEFMNLELKLILRSKRLKSQLYVMPIFIAYYFWMLYSSIDGKIDGAFILLFFGIFMVGFLGVTMGQYLFMTESSYFDGLMSRKLSLLDLLKSKYALYSSYSFVVALFLLIPAFSGKLELLAVAALLFYVTGPIYFLIFQNAVYNKTHFDIFEGGMMNWKGTSSSTMIISMLTMFVPITLVIGIQALFSKETGYWFMIITGLALTFTSNQWLNWTYKRFLKRKYKNMEGFRSNG